MIQKEDITRLYEAAGAARKNSYSPYSNFKVGASLLLDDNTIVSGTNVENSSYGLACCAERNALFQLVSAGYSKEDVEAFCIVGDTAKPISPCGACRQVMAELLDMNTKVVLANINHEYLETTVKELLPYCFEEIENAN